MNTTSIVVQRTVATSSRSPVQGRALGNVPVLSIVTVFVFAAFVLVGLDGWTYYTTPVGVRAYSPAHRLLRPSGPAGHLFGIGGFVMMLVPIAYSLRKKVSWLRGAGTMKTWLEVHIFSGIVGPVLVTFHTSFKFNGLVSVAYWSMVAVVLSGFVGRYLFVRIPRSLRGVELTRAELDARAEELSQKLADAALPARLLAKIEAFERRVAPPSGQPTSLLGLFVGELQMRRELKGLRHDIAKAGVAPQLLRAVVHVIAERATLLRHAAYLTKTKWLFDLWHVFHMPLVYVMFFIVALHVALTVYMGYVPFVY